MTYSRTSFDIADRKVSAAADYIAQDSLAPDYYVIQYSMWSAVRRDLLSEAHTAALVEDTQHSNTMLTRFQLDAYLTTQAMLKSWGPSYQTELDHVTAIIASEIDLAVDAALLEDLWRCDSSGNVLPVADSYRRRAAQQTFNAAWTTGSTFALIDALRTAQPVSLVKSAPATYCSGDSRYRYFKNDLNILQAVLIADRRNSAMVTQ